MVINDVRSYADVSGSLYSNQWSLPPGYDHFHFDLYIKYLGATLNTATIIASGNSVSSTQSTITLASGSSNSNNFYNNYGIDLLTGNGAVQVRTITGYSGNNKRATISPNWDVTPNSSTTYRIMDYAGTSIQSRNNDSSISGTQPNRLIKDIYVKASDSSFYGPTAGSGTVSRIATGTSVEANKIIAVVQSGKIQLKNVPAGYYSIGLQWTNDEYYGSNDANALIANISLTKGTLP